MMKMRRYMFLLILLAGIFIPLASAFADFGSNTIAHSEGSGPDETITYGGASSGGVEKNEDTPGIIETSISTLCSLGEFLNSKDCVFCNMFKAVFNTASELALVANNQLATPCKSLVTIGFMIWLFFYLLKQVGTPNATSTGEMLKGILFQGFRVAVVISILSGAIFEVMNLTLNPVMQTGFNFANNLSPEYACNKSAAYMKDINGFKENYTSGSNITGGLPINIGESIVCSIKKLEDATGVMMGMGKYSICLANNNHRMLKNILPGVGYLTTGWVLWIAGAVLLLMFPWCLIDCILQLCVAAALIPCAIAAFAFKITEKYIKVIWGFFMNAMFNFVFMAVIVYIINSNLAGWLGLTDLINGLDGKDEIFVSGGMIDIMGGEYEGLAWWGIGAIKVMAICFFCFTFFEEASEMAKTFADSPDIGGRSGLGRMVGGTIAGAAATYGFKPAAHYAQRGAEAVGQSINSAVGNKTRSMTNHAIGYVTAQMGKRGFGTGEAIVDPETGKTVGYKSTMQIAGKDVEITARRDENGVWERMSTSHERSDFDKAFEPIRGENGELMRDEKGHVKYQSHQRALGITTGYEEMIATEDENGNIHYETADGSRAFTMDKDGEVISYKTPYTRSLLRPGGYEKEVGKQYGTTQTFNDGLSTTTTQTDTHGNVISSKTEFKNVSADHLVNTDGTLNANAFNQIKNGSANNETAATYMVAEVMKSRGLELPQSFSNRNVEIHDDGSFTIVQQNAAGKDQNGNTVYTQRVINAQIVDNQMVIDMQTTDAEGNITHHKSNGMQTLTERFTVQRDDNGNIVTDAQNNSLYERESQLTFSDYLHNTNRGKGPLSSDGKWGNRANRDKVMAGFTQREYDMHLAQIKMDKLRRSNTKAKFDKELKTAGSEVNTLHRQLRQKNITLDEVMAQSGMKTAQTRARELPQGTTRTPGAGELPQGTPQTPGTRELPQGTSETPRAGELPKGASETSTSAPTTPNPSNTV